jgi:hypothetical protein
VADVAKGLAHEVYDYLMTKHDDLYQEWREKFPDLGSKALEDKFVKMTWSNHVPAARATLANQLSLPGPDSLKDTILEALILDNTLIRGRAALPPPPRSH